MPLVAIIGRPNVGKSTLFNRMLGKRTAIVDDVPGVTRDGTTPTPPIEIGRSAWWIREVWTRPHQKACWPSSNVNRSSPLPKPILILLMDGRTGLTTPDHEVVRLLRGTPNRCFSLINKIDTPKAEPLVADFYQLGTETLYPISAGTRHRRLRTPGCHLSAPPCRPMTRRRADNVCLAFAVVGRPNVGKSTLVNAVLGQERVVVTDVPGTTRDQSIHWSPTMTGGISYRYRGDSTSREIDRGIEGYSVVATHPPSAGRTSVLFVGRAFREGVTEQDTKIAGIPSSRDGPASC